MKNPLTTALKTLTDAAKDNSDVVTEYVSMAADAAFDTEIFEKVPFLGIIVKGMAFVDAAMKYKLARNVAAFLNVARSGDPEAMQRAFQKVYGDPRNREDVADTVMQVLTDAQKPLKAEMVGRMFVAVGMDQLRVEDFNIMSLIILQASVPALIALHEFGKIAAPNGTYAFRFPHQELLVGLGVAISTRGGTSLTTLGHKMAVFGFGLPVPEQFTPGLDELIARP